MTKQNAKFGKELHQVLLEWDGEAPPSRWYRRLEAIAGITARGNDADKSVSALVRRANGNETIAQEGNVICSSYSLAREIATLAQGIMQEIAEDWKRDPVKAAEGRVYAGRVLLTKLYVDWDFAPNKQDAEILKRMERVLSKKGKKPPASDYVVTCFEEGKTHAHSASTIVNCPCCSGVQIRSRLGNLNHFVDPGGDIVEAWTRTRFSTGKFEVPAIGTGGEIAPAMSEIGIMLNTEREVAQFMVFSPIAEQIKNMDRIEAMEILDAILSARLYWSMGRRSEIRLQAVTAYLTSNMDVTGIMLAEMPTFDLFDCAPVLGAPYAANLMARHMGIQVAKVAPETQTAPAMPGLTGFVVPTSASASQQMAMSVAV